MFVLCTGCGIALHYYPTYSQVAAPETADNVTIDVCVEPSLNWAVPALIVVWLAHWSEPYDTKLEFRGPADDFYAVRVDNITLTACDGEKWRSVKLICEPDFLGKWETAQTPALGGPDWGVILGGFWWPLPLPRHPLGWLWKQPDFKVASIRPLSWKVDGSRAKDMELKVEYTVRGRFRNWSGQSEIRLARRAKVFVTFAALMD